MGALLPKAVRSPARARSAASPAPEGSPVLSSVPMNSGRRRFLAAFSAAGLLRPVATRAQTATPPVDPLGVRADFPAADKSLYLDAAYITPTPLPVVEAGRAFAESKAHQPISLGDMLSRTDQVREAFARLIGAQSSEIGFLFSTSEGENIVAQALGLTRGDNVVVDELHYNTSFVLYRHLEATRGVELRIVKARDGGVTAADSRRSSIGGRRSCRWRGSRIRTASATTCRRSPSSRIVMAPGCMRMPSKPSACSPST